MTSQHSMWPRFFKIVALVAFLGMMTMAFSVVKVREQRQRSAEPMEYDLAQRVSQSIPKVASKSQIELDDRQTDKESISQPLLPPDCPEWVAQPDNVAGSIHHIAVGTDLANSKEEARTKLDEAMLSGIRRYIDEHLSDNQSIAAKLDKLNAEWIRKHLMDEDFQYDAEISRLGETYHQLWVQLKIGPDERDTLAQWIQGLETFQRARAVGLAGGIAVFCLVVLNAGLGIFVKKP
ncbi:MAG: hypothetical protein SGI77_11100 [Pirellulaceae bacterium]|nr:hypothetical protein [Pirellulaceae bacterium]